MVSCKQVTWINKQMKMVHGVVESNIYILSSSMLSSFVKENYNSIAPEDGRISPKHVELKIK